MGHTYTSLFVHAIFSTRQRERVLTPELRPHLYAYVTGIAKRMGVRIIQIGGVEEHLHLLAEIPAKFSVSLVLEKIKTNSSRWINRTRQISREFHWQDGYGAYSVSASAVQAVKRYIQNQEEHHRRVSFQDEVRAFLRKHEIEFDEKYLWSDD